MKFEINDYTKVVENLKLFIDINMERKVEDGTHLFEFDNNTYLLSDNGGETNVTKLNKDSLSIPHTSRDIEVSPKVLAYRIATYLTKGYNRIHWNVDENIINKVKEKYKTYKVEVINYTAKEVS